MSDIHPATPMGSPEFREIGRIGSDRPVTAGRPATPAMTPGQAACEAFWRAVEAGSGRGADAHPAAWNWAQNQRVTGAWERAAHAVYESLRAERDQLQAAHNALSVKNAELAAERDADIERIAQLALERDHGLDALDKIRHGLEDGEGQPLSDDEIIAIARKALGLGDGG